jgi:hypothetical protein
MNDNFLIPDNHFHISWCPFCNHGWVDIIKDSGNDKMFLLCYECDTTWNSPEDIIEDNPVEYNLVGNLKIPSLKEIQEIGWDKFLIS